MSSINIDYKGNTYNLEFTADSAAALQEAGFVVGELRSKPNVMIPLLVHYAFMANHKRLPYDLIEEIYRKIPQKDEFIMELAQLYAEPINALLDEPEDDEGNATWTKSEK